MESTVGTRKAVTPEEWRSFEERGYLFLGRVLGDEPLAQLQDRIDQIMLGKAEIDYDQLLMQLDGSAGQTRGFKGSTMAYRKIQGLETDHLFGSYLRQPVFEDVCRRVYGPVAVSCFRAMVLNKPARGGTFLAWHQDRWPFLDRDPLLSVWTALDASKAGSGAVQVIPGSHRSGVINPDGFLAEEEVEEHCPPERRVALEVKAGEAVVLHNWLLHSSDANPTDTPRRGFSVCYMDERTTDRVGSRVFPTVFDAKR